MIDLVASQVPVLPEYTEGIQNFMNSTDHGRRFSEIFEAAKRNWNSTTTLQKACLGGLALGLAFEWGVGNEVLLGYVGGHTLETTNSPAITAAVTGVTSFTEQAALGVATAINLRSFPDGMKKLRENYGPVKDSSDLEIITDNESQAIEEKKTKFPRLKKLLGRFAISFGLGASAVVLGENALQEDRKFSSDIKVTLQSAAMVAAGVTVLAGAVANVPAVLDTIGLESYGQTFMDYAANPLTYTAAFGLFAFWKYRQNQKDLLNRIQDRPADLPAVA